MDPRLKKALAIGLGLLLLGGLLLSGGVHSVLHADDASTCDACWLAGDEVVEPCAPLGLAALVRAHVAPPSDLLHEVAPAALPPPRGPPRTV